MQHIHHTSSQSILQAHKTHNKHNNNHNTDRTKQPPTHPSPQHNKKKQTKKKFTTTAVGLVVILVYVCYVLNTSIKHILLYITSLQNIQIHTYTSVVRVCEVGVGLYILALKIYIYNDPRTQHRTHSMHTTTHHNPNYTQHNI